GAERGADRFLDGSAEDVRFDAGEGGEFHLCTLGEGQDIAERIVGRDRAGAPELCLDAGPAVAVLLVAQLAMQRLDAGHEEVEVRAWRAVAMVLAEMQDDAAA